MDAATPTLDLGHSKGLLSQTRGQPELKIETELKVERRWEL